MTVQANMTVYAVRSGAGWIVSPTPQPGKVDRIYNVSGPYAPQRETVADLDKWQAALVRRGVNILLVLNF